MSNEDDAAEAVRKIICALCDVDPEIALTAPVLRQTIFYVWEGGEANKWRSDRPYSAAARQIRRIGIDRRILRYDHAIPLATIRRRLCEVRQSHDDTKAVLKRYVRPAILVKDEDELLSKRFRSTMPPGVQPDDAMARYREVGISFEPEDARLLSSLEISN